MNIRQKLTWGFAAIACVPVVLVAIVVVINLREQAREDFLDSSNREIRQIDNAMNQFFDAIAQNVEYLAKSDLLRNTENLKNYSAADAAQVPLPASNQALLHGLNQFATSPVSYTHLTLPTKA